MANNTEQSDLSIVFADHDQNYYLIPAEDFERGRVPAERKAEIEQLMSEHDVAGHGIPLLVLVAGAAGLAVLGGLAGDAVYDYALPDGPQASSFVPPKTSNPNDPRVY